MPALRTQRGAISQLCSEKFLRLPQAFQADQTAWTIQPMLGFVRSLRSVAEAADAEAAAAGRRPEKLADCLDKLRKLFQAAQQAAGECAPSNVIAHGRHLGCQGAAHLLGPGLVSVKLGVIL